MKSITLADLKPGAPRPGVGRPTAIVISHERSGTHFLLNSIAAAYEYPAGRIVELDAHQININYFSSEDLTKCIAAIPSASLVKSHHAVEFFEDIFDEILGRAVIFYIHRDPVDVMLSTWRYVHRWRWREGPRRDDVVDFALAEPEGQMLRYQMRQRRNMLQRWAHHVEGWIAAAERRDRIVVVPYERLNKRYRETVADFASLLGKRTGSLLPPSRTINVVHAKPLRALAEPDLPALRRAALAEAGDTMRKLGYA